MKHKLFSRITGLFIGFFVFVSLFIGSGSNIAEACGTDGIASLAGAYSSTNPWSLLGTTAIRDTGAGKLTKRYSSTDRIVASIINGSGLLLHNTGYYNTGTFPLNEVFDPCVIPSTVTFSAAASLPLPSVSLDTIATYELIDSRPDFPDEISVSSQKFVILEKPVFSASSTLQIAAEDAVINQITGGSVGISVNSTYPGISGSFSIPATNCIQIGGPKPLKDYISSERNVGKKLNRVVFVRGKSWNSDINTFLNQANAVVREYYKMAPLTNYANQLSFYVDLKKFDDTNAPTYPLIGVNGLKFLTAGFGDSIKSQSSCSTQISDDGTGSTFSADQYFFYHAIPSVYPYFSPFDKVSFLSVLGSETLGSNGGTLAIHEMAHSFAQLIDEYSETIYGVSGWFDLVSPTHLANNCTVHPVTSYRGPDNLHYGNIATVGCSGYILPTSPRDGRKLYWYRPSSSSIMMNNYLTPKFSVVDCGYMVAAIKNERGSSSSEYQANASKYFKECEGYDTAKDIVYFPNTPAPNISPSQSLSAGNAGFASTITGTGFTPTGNAVQFQNSATGAIYESLDIPSNGTQLLFGIPITAPPGSYKVRAGASNSPWSNDLSFTVSGTQAPVITSLTATTTYTSSQAKVTASWIAEGITKCTLTSNSQDPLLPYTSDLFSDWVTFIPNGSSPTLLTLKCTGPKGAAEKSINIKVVASRLSADLLLGSCSVFPTGVIGLNQLVTYTASSTGGSGPYRYVWAVDGILGGNNKLFSAYYSAPSGQKNAQVLISSGEQEITAQCPIVTYNSSVMGPVGTKSPANPSGFRSGSSGQRGTSIDILGSYNPSFEWNTSSTVRIEHAGKIMYVRPTLVSYTSNPNSIPYIRFVFDSFPSDSIGTVYNISIQNNVSGTLKYSNSVPFTLTSTASSNKFVVGDRVRVAGVSAYLNVRFTPNGTLLGTHTNTAQGTIIGGPILADDYTWWNINFDSGVDGWSVEQYLENNIIPIETVPPVVATSTIATSTVPVTGGIDSNPLIILDTVSPSIPTNTSASLIGTTTIHFSWSASSDNIKVVGYKVYRDGRLVSDLKGLTLDQSLKPGGTYCFTVAAYDKAGNASSQSTKSCITIPQAVIEVPVTGGLDPAPVTGGVDPMPPTISAPVITSVSNVPYVGKVTIEIHGRGFDPLENKISISGGKLGKSLEFTSSEYPPGQLMLEEIPSSYFPGPGKYELQVTNQNGTSNVVIFNVVAPTAYSGQVQTANTWDVTWGGIKDWIHLNLVW